MLIDPWHVPIRFQHIAHDDGRQIVYDPDTLRSWTVPAATTALVRALQNGWRPGDLPPEHLRPYVGALPREAWDSVRENLTAEGILGVASRLKGDRARVTQLGRMDVLVRVARVRAPSALIGRVTSAAARAWLPLTALMVIALVSASPVDAVHRVLALWRAYHAESPPATITASVVAVQLMVTSLHEVAHALVLASVTGRRVDVGIRFRYGCPSAYTDASAVLTLPSRLQRGCVLMAGVTVEVTLWAIACAALLTSAELTCGPLLVIAVLGPVSVATQLLPLYRNDGYYILADILREPNLMIDARAAVASFWTHQRPRRAWLPWYGLANLTLAASGIVGVGMGAGILLGAPSIATFTAVVATTLYLVHSMRSVTRAASPQTNRHDAST